MNERKQFERLKFRMDFLSEV